MKDYLYIIRCLYGIDKDVQQGYTESELLQAEQKLDCKLPIALRQYYLSLGRNKTINITYNRLLSPDEIYFTDSGHLIFYEENQAVAVWGIDEKSLKEPNPCVWGSYDMDREEWFIDSDNTENFLLAMAYWNAALGGLSYTAMKEKPLPETIALIAENWKEQTGITNQFLRFFTSDYRDLLVLTLNEEKLVDGLYIASNNKEAYHHIINKMNIQWDDCTNRD